MHLSPAMLTQPNHSGFKLCSGRHRATENTYTHTHTDLEMTLTYQLYFSGLQYFGFNPEGAI